MAATGASIILEADCCCVALSLLLVNITELSASGCCCSKFARLMYAARETAGVLRREGLSRSCGSALFARQLLLPDRGKMCSSSNL